MKNKKVFVLAVVAVLAILIHSVFFGFRFDYDSIGPLLIGLLTAIVVIAIGIRQKNMKEKEKKET